MNPCRLSRWPVLLFLMVSLTSVGPSAATSRPPNQILILVDDMGRDWVGAYGAKAVTPNFDRLAREGMRFETAWATPVCTPTRVAMLTGQYPFRSGWNVHYDVPRWGGRGLDPERFRTMGTLLREAGYATAIAGKWQVNDLRDDPDIMSRHGFDEHCLWTGVEAGNPASEKRYWDAFLQHNGKRRTHAGEFGPDVTQAFVLDFFRRNRDRPFFLYYPMIPVHAPNEPTPLNRHAPPKGEAALYAGMVTYADRQIGELLRVLDELGLRENTVIYFTGDNGSSTGGTLGGQSMPVAKGQVSDLGVHVPLIVRAPGLVPSGAVSKALMDFTDLLPTMLAVSGKPPSSDIILDGHSLVPALKEQDPKVSGRRWSYSQYGTHRAVRDQRYYLDNHGGLFDLIEDPLQRRNLIEAAVPGATEARERLAGILAALPDDAAPPFPEYVNADKLLEESKRLNRLRQQAVGEK